MIRHAVEYIVEEETCSVGGQLEVASGARRKTCARLKAYTDKTQPALFPMAELHNALEWHQR